MTTPSASTTPRRELIKVIVAAFIGTVIEWYDFFLYGMVAALVFGKLFFPTVEPWLGTMASYATYAVGFVARPLGGIFFGYIGDRYGRKGALVWTLAIMGVATFLVGCLPTYETAGIWAPILLVSLRFAQGIAVGGEWGGAVLMTVEHGHQGNRGFYGSWTQAGVPMGNLLAAASFGIAKTMPEPQFLSWGWRVPFWMGIVLTGVGFFIRRHLGESPLFEKSSEKKSVEQSNPVTAVLRSKFKSILLVIGARIAENASFYVITVFVLSYVKMQLKMDENLVLKGVLLGSALELVAIPLYGALSDRIGRRAVCMLGTVLLSLYAYPFFLMLETKDPTLIWLAVFLFLGIIHAAMYAPQAAFFAELFGTNVRYSGASLGYQLSSPIAGGPALLIAGYLLKIYDGKPWGVAAYLVAIGVISTVSVLITHETHKTDITQ